MSKKAATDTWDEVRESAIAQLPDEITGFIAQCRLEDHPESQLIAVLHRVQNHFGYLGEAQLDAVAQLLQVPQADVSGVASFYHYFRLTPRGKFVIRICLGTACYVKGGERLAEKFKSELGIDFGETTKDGLFSLEPSRCLGTCGLAPVIMINEQVHGPLTPDHVPGLIERMIADFKKADANQSSKAG